MPAPLPAPPWRISCTAQLATCHPLQHASPARLLPPLPPRTARASASVAPALPTGGPPRLESGAYSTGRMQGFGSNGATHRPEPEEPERERGYAGRRDYGASHGRGDPYQRPDPRARREEEEWRQRQREEEERVRREELNARAAPPRPLPVPASSQPSQPSSQPSSGALSGLLSGSLPKSFSRSF